MNATISRRNLLRLGAAAFGGAAAGRARTDSNLIDAHVHVWTDDLARYPLADGITRAQMQPPVFRPEDILRHARPSGVNRIVLIQMSYYRFDNSYMLDVIRTQPEVFRGIAIVDWNGEDPAGKMRQLARQGVTGFRIYPGKQKPEEWLASAGLRAMFRCGAEENLALCPLINPDVLPALDKACEQLPDTPVVIDHLARIGASQPIREADIQALCALARHRRVRVKVSAFYALGAKKPPHLDLAPLIRRVYDAFGPRRLLWASDCPFQTVTESYEDSVSLIRDRLDFLSAEDKEWILRRTAEESLFRR